MRPPQKDDRRTTPSRPVLNKAAAAALLATACAATAQDVIRGVRIVEVAAGTVGEPQDVTIRGGLIAEVASRGGALSEGATVHDATGGFATLGLWDMHVHVFSSPEERETAFPLHLLNGVTGIRDMGALLTIGEQRRIATGMEDGSIPGPRVILSGAWIDARPGMFPAATPEEGRARVREIAR